MTGVRQSVLVGKETSFGSGKVNSEGWFHLPPNFFVQATASISTTELYSTGSKFFDAVDYGQFSGSWEMSFAMDYEHLALLGMAFDTVTTESMNDGRWKHTFSNRNNAIVGSFVIQGIILNGMTFNGGKDERFTLKGCVAKSIRFSRSSGASRMSVTVSGFYQDEEVYLADGMNSYYEDYDGRLMEFACLFKGDATDANYMANVESITVGLDIGTAGNSTTCRRTIVGYYGGKNDVQLGMTAYANDFERYRAMVMGGGTKTTRIESNTYRFMCKGMLPMPRMTVAMFTECRDEGDRFEDVISKGWSASFILDDVVMNSFTRQKGDGGRLIDQMSSSKCRKLTIVIVNDREDLGTGRSV